jgi:hypothetical protein
MNNKSILSFAGLFFLSITLTFVSCNKKSGCTNPNSENYDDQAEVDDESCVNPRKKYVGQYNSFEQCNTTPNQNFFIDVREANDNLTDILIYNLANLFELPVRATISQSTFVIEKQYPDGNVAGRTVEGNGSIAGNTISIQYIIISPGSSQITKSCVVTMNK